jgi:hypothetical protein
MLQKICFSKVIGRVCNKARGRPLLLYLRLSKKYDTVFEASFWSTTWELWERAWEKKFTL